ncbi:hypothetical protein KR009_008841, partial [Drosophila setifemur]
VDATGSKRGMRCSGNRNSDDDGNPKNNRRQREHFNIYSNCHNILRTLQSLLLLMFNCGIFNKRRRRQQHQHQNEQQQNIHFTKFLLLLQALAAATTTRLSLSRNNYNQQHNQQQPPLASKRATSQVQRRHDQQHPQHRSLIWMLTLNLLAINAAAATVFELQLHHQQQHLQQNEISDRFESMVDSMRLRRAIGQPNDTIRLSHNETTCKSMDIRNTADQFNQLANCTIIEGFLLITLINDGQNLNTSFPLLTEVTEFIIVYRVIGLHSLSQIFPNLSVIRGNILFDGYSLVVYSNRDLKNLGLPNLRSISNGSVRIEKNPLLCFVQTIDWLHIMAENATSTDLVLQLNGKESKDAKCDKCPGGFKVTHGDPSAANGDEPNVSCKEYPDHKRYCWSSSSCQTICPKECRNNCIDENTCCNKACLGGCIRDGAGNERCISCRYLSINNTTCVDSCPPGFYRYDRRCITAEMCIQIGTRYEGKELPLASWNGQCTTRCPQGFQMQKHTCIRCPNDKCEKKCSSGMIDSLVRAREFHGCTVITGSALQISIKREGRSHIMEALEFGLAEVHTIQSALKVHLTYGLSSLRFFKSLREISGQKLEDNRYALYVLENNDLEEIWAPNQTVFIKNGGVFFHFNRKLCVDTINKLLPMLASKPEFFNKSEVATDSNGNRGSCGTSPLGAKLISTGPRAALLQVDKSMVSEGEKTKQNENATIVFKDPRAFIGFQFYYARDPYGNITKSSYQPCDNTWTVSVPQKNDRYILENLTPFTRYAFYVRTMAISSETTNGQSDIIRFRTLPAQPSMVPGITATSNSDSQIHVMWNNPRYPYGKLTYFLVKVELTNRTKEMPQTDYCSDPIIKAIEGDLEVAPTSPEKTPLDPVCLDCQCEDGEKKSSAQDYDDRNIHAGMEFENALQNYIYVPSTKNKTAQTEEGDAKGAGSKSAAFVSNAIGNGEDAIRHKRDLAMESAMHELGGSVLLRHVRSTKEETKANANALVNANANVNVNAKGFPSINPSDSHLELVNEKSRMSANGQYYEIYVNQVPANQTSFTFEKLRHFTLYTIYVLACRERIEGDNQPSCSATNPIYKMTKPKDTADVALNLTVHLENSNNTDYSVRLRWLPPLDPNGEIVAYDVAYKLLKPNQVEEKKCIMASKFANLTNGFPLKLNEGSYSFRVRPNSMAGLGVFTDYVYANVDPPLTLKTYLIWLVVCVFMLVIIVLVAYAVHLRKTRRPNDLHINTEVNPFYASMQYIPDDWEVLRENIIQLAPLGQGSFGMVYEGILKSYAGGGVDRECAIKTVNENATDRERTNFLSEASVMKEFDTYHVVRLLGVCSRGQPALVVMELMKKGDLKSYLRAHRPEERDEAMEAYLQRIGVTGNVQPPTYGRIYQMAIEIADGMAYLAAKKFVHRDLAARNCMVADDLTVKIGDFGMTRDVYETDYYRKGTKGLLPVRWMPPESLRDGVYSSASDVFSFGVVLWEMATLAAQPYQGLSNEQVLRYVIDGGVMERPENCPEVLHALMQRCWHHRSSARPSFLDIIAYLEQQCPESLFKDVSFYHSEAGQTHREKERKERSQQDAFAAVPLAHDQPEVEQQEDATRPLRVGDYQDYISKMEHDSSLDQPAESPIAMDDHATHSPFSLQSGFIASSTPDGQTVITAGFQNLPASQGDDAAAYVQPDGDGDRGDKGYEIYDPSPNFADLPTSRSGSTGAGGGGRMSGEQHLLPQSKSRKPVIMSSSMPDEVIAGSSLQPSTASAASSNCSSSNTGTGRLRALTDTLRHRANILPTFLFNHRRTGSNVSHRSNASNAPSTSSNSNLTSHPVAMGNLGTIESGGSGSAGSYTGTPRFYTPTATPIGGGEISISDNPNYKLLDESMGSEQATILTTSSPNPNYEMMHPPASQVSDNPNYVAMNEPQVQMAGVTISHNPNYQPMRAPLTTLADEDNEREEDFEDDDYDDEDLDDDLDDEHVEHIKMERMPLSRDSRKALISKSQPQRSRSVSQSRKSPTNSNSNSGSGAGASANNLRKEHWLRQNSNSNSRQPPPNGFIGREA